MSTEEKMLDRLMSCPSDYTYTEAKALAKRLGYQEKNKGSTSGSRVLFYRERDKRKIMLHKPHPGNFLKGYAVKQLINSFRENGDIDEQ